MRDTKETLMYILKRVLLMIVTFLIIFVICFILIRLLPFSAPGGAGSDISKYYEMQVALGRR